MPEKEARPPAQNRHGGAPRGERVPLDARRASGSADRRARQRDNRNSAPFGAPLAPHEADGKEESKTRAQQRAAGRKKTALFDIVNRNCAANALVPRPSARRSTRVGWAKSLAEAGRSAPISRAILPTRVTRVGIALGDDVAEDRIESAQCPPYGSATSSFASAPAVASAAACTPCLRASCRRGR